MYQFYRKYINFQMDKYWFGKLCNRRYILKKMIDLA